MQAVFSGQLWLLWRHVVTGQVLPRPPCADAGDHSASDTELLAQRNGALALLQAFVDEQYIGGGELVAARGHGLKTRVNSVLGVLLRRAVFEVGKAVVSLVAVAVVDPGALWTRTNEGKHHKAVDGGLLPVPERNTAIALGVLPKLQSAPLHLSGATAAHDLAVEAANRSVVADFIARVARNGLE